MDRKPTYEELEKRIKELENEVVKGKRADEALRESEERLATFMESATDGFVLFDSELNHIKMNKAALEITGLEQKDVIGKNVIDTTPNIKESGRYDEYKKVMKSGVPIHIPDLTSHPLTGDKYIELKAFKVGDGLGIIFTDITGRKQAEKMLTRSETFLNATGQIAKVGGWEIDGETKKVFWTKEIYNITEVPNDYNPSSLEKEAIVFFSTEDQLRLEKAIQRAFEHDEPYDMEFLITTAKGNKKWVQAICEPIVVDGKVVTLGGTFQDITERKRAEEVLRESEKEYRSTLNDLLVGVVVHASDTSILLSNPEATAILGLTYEQMSGKKTIDPTWNFVHEDSTIMKVKDYPVSKVFSTKKPLYDYVVGINRPDRDYVTWVIVNAIPVFLNNSELEKVVVNFVDITARKQAEEALRESEGRYRTILATIEDSYYEVNQSGEITFFNEAFSKIIGYPPDELMGMRNDKYLDQKSRRKVFKLFNEVWETGIPSKLFEYELIRKNGEKRTVQTSVSLMTDENGQKVGFRGIIRDVSYHKLMEKALRVSEEKYRLLIENANDAIFIVQDEGIKFPNPKGEEMTGYSAEELAKMPFINLIHPDDRDMVLDRHKRRLSGEKLPATYNFKIVNKAREEFWVQLNTVVINWEGRPATLNFLRDITEQMELEAQLQQTHKMEAIATLAGGIAHEFNNALTSVVGNIQLLEMDFADNKTVTEHTEAMKTSSHRMVNLTSQLLAYARGGRYQAKTISLSDFVEDTLPIIKSNIDPSIRLEADLPRDIFSVEADPAQLQMVLSAVVSNSTEAIEGDGRIRITASNEEIDSEFAKNHPELNPGRYVCLTVEDDGKGMDAETLNKIFDPFYTTKFTGRGLGMAAVYGIIRNHDGWITVDSELNKGTIIRIYLPALEAEEVKRETIVEYAAEMPKGEGTVLIIEDEEMVMNVIRDVLERLGYRMLEAKTGREAVEIAKTFDGDIDLALLDIKLPDIRGDKVYPLIMESRPNLKVIVCSGYSIDTARGILDAGAQDFIQKPFNVKVLSQKLREILEKE